MITDWDVDCPVCGFSMCGDEEIYDETTICPGCGSVLAISACPTWETHVEVYEDKSGDCSDDDDSEIDE